MPRAPLAFVFALALLACGSAGSPPGGASGSTAPPGISSSTDAGAIHGDAGAPGAPPGPPLSGDASAPAPPPTPPPAGAGLGAASFGPGELDPPSHGGTITFEQIGAAGSFPSRRDPATGPCDAYQTSTCCLATETIPGDALTPWDEDLIMTLRGPAVVKQIAVYQPAPSDASTWQLVSGWDSRSASAASGIAFDGNATPKTPFSGGVGSECLVNVSTASSFPCGAGSVPYCPASSSNDRWGWAGSKLIVILATMPHSGGAGAPAACSTTSTGGWYDASWIGLSVGELVRAGAFSSCQCYAKDPSKGYLADGCGQFNVFEVVNDNNSYKNLDVFSTDLIDYSGYVGEGPCGGKCGVAALSGAVDLIDKSNDLEAAQGATATPKGGPGAALRRPEQGYRYFVIALDVPSRTVQLALVHPQSIPAAMAPLLPALPATIGRPAVDAVLGVRLPK